MLTGSVAFDHGLDECEEKVGIYDDFRLLN